MAKFSCEIKKLLVLGADPSFLYKKPCTLINNSWAHLISMLNVPRSCHIERAMPFQIFMIVGIF